MRNNRRAQAKRCLRRRFLVQAKRHPYQISTLHALCQSNTRLSQLSQCFINRTGLALLGLFLFQLVFSALPNSRRFDAVPHIRPAPKCGAEFGLNFRTKLRSRKVGWCLFSAQNSDPKSRPESVPRIGPDSGPRIGPDSGLKFGPDSDAKIGPDSGPEIGPHFTFCNVFN